MKRENNKRKKFHDKDKYYRLAKEQGYRSRAAFKMTQINRKFHFLENAKVVIDLCAAPGGWSQVASRTMSIKNGGTILLAVDILPIRAIPNVITLIGDITTEKTKAELKSQLQTASADVVLCDGAPNVGASYDRDAYQQNEIALHALKCATQHLKRNGTFVTKLYRSSDYISYIWVVKQLFEKVQAVKPASSRSQSAEIFLVCTGYLDPTSIDPRLLDPKSVFEQVTGAATGGGDSFQNQGASAVTIFHKKFGEKRRSRQGYDMTHLDGTMRNIGSISSFVEAGTGENPVKDGKNDPIQILSNCTALTFTCHLCKEKSSSQEKNEGGAVNNIPDCNCKFYLEHKITTPEIKACVSDLKVLNKSDFKGLLTWRVKMQKVMEQSQDLGDNGKKENSTASDEEDQDSEAEEEGIQVEIEKLRQKKNREQKHKKKKEREVLAKRRRRAALGMNLSVVDLPDNDKIFTLATMTSKGDLEAMREVEQHKVSKNNLLNIVEDSDKEEFQVDKNGNIIAQGEEDDIDENTGYSYRLDRELDEAYDLYLSNTNHKATKVGTKIVKQSRKMKAVAQTKEDDVMMCNDTKTYAKLLEGPKDSDSGSSDGYVSSGEESDGFHISEEHKDNREKNPLIHTFPVEPTSVKTTRWFSNPLFETIENTASLATVEGRSKFSSSKANANVYDSDDIESQEHISNEDSSCKKSKVVRKRSRRKVLVQNCEVDSPITADAVLEMMPKTDKQIRHEKRVKAIERKNRQLSRRARSHDNPEASFEVVTGDDKESNKTMNTNKIGHLNGQEQEKIRDARHLIKAGLGKYSGEREVGEFEVVSKADSEKANGLLPIVDSRNYNSDNEKYDSDDYAQTLALGTMMLRKSKEKAFIDASYNRFAWNDPEDLPHWFLDDENKNYRPQLPIPPDLLIKMKEQFLSLATKPIAKVAEARARKNKKVKVKMAAARKKAESLAVNSSEMSEAMKLKAISKAMRGQLSSRPERTYVVSKKGGGTKGGKGIKLVDKRMRSDKRSMDRAEKKRSKGKKSGLTGSKRRRNHK